MPGAVRAIAGVVIAGVGLLIGNPKVIEIGILMAIEGATSALGRPRVREREERGQTIVTPLARLPVVYGRDRLGLHLAFIGLSDNNRFLWMIGAVCHGPVASLDEIYIDGNLAVNAAGTIQSSPVNYVGPPTRIAFGKYLGPDNQDTGTTGKQGAGGGGLTGAGVTTKFPEWTTAHRGRGVAYLILECEYDEKLFSSIPHVEIAVSGRTLFDPRTSGTAYSTNPILAIRDYLSSSRYGAAVAASEIYDGDASEGFWAMADECDRQIYLPANTGMVAIASSDLSTDEITTTGNHGLAVNDKVWVRGHTAGVGLPDGQYTVSTVPASNRFKLTGVNITAAGSGGTVQKVTLQAQFTLHGSLDTNRTLKENLEGLSTACRANLVFQGGQYRVFIRRAQAPVAYELTEDQIDGDLEMVTPGARETANVLRVIFPNVLNNYEPDTFIWPPLTATNPYLADDNSYRIERSLELPYTTDEQRAGLIANVAVEELRNNIWIQGIAKEEALRLGVGDVVNVHHYRFGWGNDETTNRFLSSSQAGNPTTVHFTANHGLATGQRIRISGCDVSALNGDWDVTVLDADSITIPVNSAGVATTGVIRLAPKRFTIMGLGIRPDGQVVFAAVEYEPTAYDQKLTDDSRTAPDTNIPSPWTVQPPTNLVLSTGTRDPRILVQWTGSVSVPVRYLLQAKRTGPAGREDPDYIPYPDATPEAPYGYIPVAETGETWSVRVATVNGLGIVSAWLTGTHTVNIVRNAQVSVGTRVRSTTAIIYPIDFGLNCYEVVVYSIQNDASGGANPPETSTHESARYNLAAVPSGHVDVRLATASGKYRRTLVVAYDSDGRRGADTGILEDQATGGGTLSAPTALTKTSGSQTTLSISWGLNGQTLVKTRIFINGVAQTPTALDATTRTLTGLQPNTTYQIDAELFKDTGEISPKHGVVNMTTDALTTAPTGFAAGLGYLEVLGGGKIWKSFDLSWNAIPGVSWEIYESQNSTPGSGSQWAAGSSGTTSKASRILGTPGNFYYWLRGTNPLTAWAALAQNPLEYTSVP